MLRLLGQIMLSCTLLWIGACQTSSSSMAMAESPDTSPTPMAKPIVPAKFLTQNKAAGERDVEVPEASGEDAPTTNVENLSTSEAAEKVDDKGNSGTSTASTPTDGGSSGNTGTAGKERCNEVIRTKITNLENDILTLNRDIKLTNDTEQRKELRSEIKDYEKRLKALKKRYDCF